MNFQLCLCAQTRSKGDTTVCCQHARLKRLAYLKINTMTTPEDECQFTELDSGLSTAWRLNLQQKYYSDSLPRGAHNIA